MTRPVRKVVRRELSQTKGPRLWRNTLECGHKVFTNRPRLQLECLRCEVTSDA